MPSAFTVRTCRYLPEALELVRRFGCVTGDAVAKQLGLARGSLQYSLYCAWRHGLVTTYGISRRTRAWCVDALKQLAGSLNGRIVVLRVSDIAETAAQLIERGVRYMTARRVVDAMGIPRTITWAHDIVHAVLRLALDGVPSERLRTRHGGRGWLITDITNMRAAVEGLSRIAEAGELPLEPDPPPPPPAPRRRSDGVYVSAHVPHNYVDLMNMLVKAGVYPSRSEIVRDAIRKLLEQYRGA